MLLVITTLFFSFIKKMFIFEIPVRRKMLNISPANVLIIQPWGKTEESYQPSLDVEFSPFHCSHVVPFLCLLLEREVKYSQMETDQLTLEAWWINTSCGGFKPFWEQRRTQRKWKELKGTKPVEIIMFET